MASALPTINTEYTNIFVTNNGPNLDNIRKFSINWSLENNGLYVFAFNTDNGVPNWYVSMLGGVSHSLNSSQPEISVSNSGFAGFDGDYYAIMDGDNFVLAEKSGAYTIYFSNSSTSPCDELKQGILTAANNASPEINLFPNPTAGSHINISGLPIEQVEVVVYDMLGKTMLKAEVSESQNKVDVSTLKSGSYMLVFNNGNKRTTKLFNKL